MRVLTVKGFVVLAFALESLGVAVILALKSLDVVVTSFVSQFFIAESGREICEGSLRHGCALPRSEETEKRIGWSGEDAIADALLICGTAGVSQFLSQKLDLFSVSSDAVLIVEGDVKELLLKSLSSLDGVLLILVLERDSNVSCSVTC